MAFFAISLMAANYCAAGGLLTNTNQNVAFNRMLSRDASIGIDGVYSNPAGVAFMADGAHLSINWQMARQTRTIKNDYALFTNNTNNPITPRDFKGKAFAPVLPSVQFAYNHKNISWQAGLAVGGGGGKCKFENGLGSFERIVSETAAGACAIAGAIDQTTGTPYFTTDRMFGNEGKYTYESYMRGRQYYYGLSLGAAYKFRPDLSGYVGLRGVYATCNYYGYVRNIKVGNVPLYSMLDATRTNSADIELNCNQSGFGFTPIIGIDYKTKHWNFAAKYEFKTRIRLKNESVNQIPSIGNLPANLINAFVQAGIPEQTAAAIVSSERVAGAMTSLKSGFDKELTQAIGEYADDAQIPGDIPAMLTVGVGYSPVTPLRINAGFHYYWDKQAVSYNHHEKKLKRGTYELSAGVEYDAAKFITVSAGWQNTNYGITDSYMDDKSFVVNSNSVATGACLHLSKTIDVNIAYFCTLYGHKKTAEQSAGGNYTADYTRSNNVLGIGVDLNL